MRILPGRGDQCGASFVEFAVCMALIGIFVGVLLERSLYYQEYAEKTAMESTAQNIRTGLRYKVADLVLSHPVAEIQTVADEKPMGLLAGKAGGYVGDLDFSRTREVT